MSAKRIWLRHEDLAIRKECTVQREEFMAYMTFQRNERPLFTEIFGPLVGLKEEWLAQGASKAELDFSAFRYRCPRFADLPVSTGRYGGAEPIVLEETEDILLSRDELGRTMKLSKGVSTLAIPQDYPVRMMEDWLRLKPLYEFSPQRLAGAWESFGRGFQDSGGLLRVSMPGGYDEPRQLMGEERLALAFYDQPEMIQDMLDTFANTALQVLKAVCARLQVDILFVHEDMAGRAGPMIGPRQVETYIVPYYRRIWDFAQQNGVKLFDQDSDGNMEAVIPAFLEAGVNMMHPIEPAAGMDLVKLRRQYGGRLAFYGGIDKHVLRSSKAEIEAELEYKLPPLIASGGCMFALDHRVPNGTPLENYHHYIERVWAIFERLG